MHGISKRTFCIATNCQGDAVGVSDGSTDWAIRCRGHDLRRKGRSRGFAYEAGTEGIQTIIRARAFSAKWEDPHRGCPNS